MSDSRVAIYLEARWYLTSLIEIADGVDSTMTILTVESDAVLVLLRKPARGTNPIVLLRTRATPPS